MPVPVPCRDILMTAARARLALPSDAMAIATIYNRGIDGRTATFETRHRSAAEVEEWFDGRHPIVVVEEDGEIVAFASTAAYRSRECYRGIAEFSVYVAEAARRRGAGAMAMSALIDAAKHAGFEKLLSRVFIENMASRALLRSAGFREVGIYERHAQLDGLWRDVMIVERLLDHG